MIKTIIHIADVHIVNSTDEYEEKQKSLIKSLVKEAKKYKREELRIVLVGDTFDGKVKASNEAKKCFYQLLNVCNSICPTYIVAGNHDMLQNNTDKMDSIAPTFEIKDVYKNIKYIDKETGFKSGCIVDDNIVWVLYSMHDHFARPDLDAIRNEHPDSILVGLYHGDVPGATTDVGFMHESGLPGEAFAGLDCVMAGHIHRRQEIRKEGVPIVYSGSVFQKDFGENATGHGFEVWNLETMEHTHVEVENPYKFYKFRIENYDDVKEDKEKLLNL